MADKYFSLVLHSHIPYVLAHGSWPHGMDWLYEAAAETYMPLLDVFERLAGEGIAARTNVSFTPVLMEQLKDPGFARGFDEYLRMKIEIAVRDREYFDTDRECRPPSADRFLGGLVPRSSSRTSTAAVAATSSTPSAPSRTAA